MSHHSAVGCPPELDGKALLLNTPCSGHGVDLSFADYMLDSEQFIEGRVHFINFFLDSIKLEMILY